MLVPSGTGPANGAAKTVAAAHGRLAALSALAANPATSSVLASLTAVKEQYRQALRDTVAGKTTGHAGDTRRWTRTEDPLADDLTARFGDHAASTAVASGVAFLLLWLDEACDHPDFPVADFAGELRSMSAELARILGDRPDQMWIGRCPTRVTDIETGQTSPCGAGLWQDPHASQVQCPRCHCTWGPRRVDLLHLATEMRRTWPVDRRRLYTVEETLTVRRPRCPACGSLTDISWRDVTGVGEHPSVYQAVGAVCEAGCDEAKQVI